MNKLIRISIFLAFTALSLTGSSETYYVAPSGGDDKNPGSKDSPWETWQKAFEVAEAGDTVYFRGGVYYSLVRNDIDPSRGIGNSGTYSNPIVYMSYPGEWAILDCSRHIETYGFGNGKYNGAISINRAEHLHFKNFEVRNVFQLDSLISGGISASSSRNLTFEHIIMHNIGQRGFYIQGGAWLSHYEDDKAMGSPRNVSYPPWPDYTDTTKFINCDVYNLCDSISRTGGWDPGNGADAWKTIHYRGNYVLWQGCRAWNYTDDGYDPSTINGATRVFDNCWAMASNKYKNSFPGYTMERNGFKIPGSEFYPEHNPEYTILQNCLSLFSVRGLYLLYIEGWGDVNARMYNNTSYANGINYSGGKPTDTFKNNLSYGATALNAFGEPYECASMSNGIIESNNTWDWSSGYPWFTLSKEVTVTDADFVGITGNWVVDSLYLVDLFTAPRQADGSLPAQRPLMLAPTSDLINAGVNVGIPYYGSAPDIGYSEYASGTVVIVPPILLDATIENATPSRLELSYDLSLANIKPSTSSFSVKVNSSIRNVNSVAISGTKVLLTLASPVTYGEIVTVSYTKPSTNPLQSIQGGQVASIINKPVINNCSLLTNSFPTISITSPQGGASFISPASITFVAVAEDSDGYISKVEFFNSSVKLAERTSIPYTFTWTGVNEGSYSITAIATDNLNAKTVSTPVTVVVERPGTSVNQLPVVMIISPEKESDNKKNDNITFEIHAMDPDGSISHVELRNGNYTLAEFTEPPYVFTWHNVDTGTYHISAIATDNLGAISVSPAIEIKVGSTIKAMTEMINLYPNPNDGRFTMEMDPLLTELQINNITIINLSGQTVYKERINGSENSVFIDLSWINSGPYVILLTNGKGIVATIKFIKQ